MVKIDLSFSGWRRGCEISRVICNINKERPNHHPNRIRRPKHLKAISGESGCIRLIDESSGKMEYNITVECFLDWLNKGKLFLSFVDVVDSDCSDSETELYDFDIPVILPGE